MVGIGTITNVAAVTAGSLIGLLLKSRLPANHVRTMTHAVGLFTVWIGLSMALKATQPIVVLVSLVAGGVIGESLGLESKLEGLGLVLERRLTAAGARSVSGFARGFVAASLLFCVGPMTIVGSVEDGLAGNYQILLTKSVMDGVSSVALASGLGVGVLGSALTVATYQGGLTLLAAWARGIVNSAAVTQMSAAGGLMILGIGLNMLEIMKIRVGNLLPGLLIALVLGLALA